VNDSSKPAPSFGKWSSRQAAVSNPTLTYPTKNYPSQLHYSQNNNSSLHHRHHLGKSHRWHHPNNATATPVESRLGQILEQKDRVAEEAKQQSSDTAASSPHLVSARYRNSTPTPNVNYNTYQPNANSY